jgi:hypothetical protein
VITHTQTRLSCKPSGKAKKTNRESLIYTPSWKNNNFNFFSRVFAAFKWPGCWVVGIVLVTILIVNLDKDPFVIGQQTIKIEEIPFASIGFTPQGAFESDYYENARK